MRKLTDAKAMARTLGRELAARGVKLNHAQSLELIAKTLGEKDWNTLSAKIKPFATESADVEQPFTAWPNVAKAHYERHLSREDRLVPLQTRNARWQSLFNEANVLYHSGETSSSQKVLDLTRRWLEFSWAVSGDNLDYKRKSFAAYSDALRDPKVGPHLPVSGEVLSFLQAGFKAAWSERTQHLRTEDGDPGKP